MQKTFRIVPISFIFILIVISVALSACAPGQPLGPTLTPTHTPTATHTPAATIDVSATSIAATENFRATLESVAATETTIVSSTSAAKTQDAIIKAKHATATKEAFLAAEQLEKDIITAAENICGGKGFPGAAKYIYKRDFHPLVLFPDKYTYPQEVRPDSLNELEIVVCIDKSEETFRRQEYKVRKNFLSERGYYCLDNVQLWTITIRGAQTGKVVHEFKIRGPRSENRCGDSELFGALNNIFGENKTKSKTGAAPDFTIIWNKIESLVLLDMNSNATPEDLEIREQSSSLSGRISFVSTRDGNPEIYTINANGTNLKRLTWDPALDHEPAWSPDGSQIAFTSERDGNWEIYLMDSSGKNLENITNHSSHDTAVAWSPDGSEIAFFSNRNGNWDIYVMNLDSRIIEQLTTNLETDSYPAWSPQ
jgi:hypothetical protein